MQKSLQPELISLELTVLVCQFGYLAISTCIVYNTVQVQCSAVQV